jgi:hypothetical protein
MKKVLNILKWSFIGIFAIGIINAIINPTPKEEKKELTKEDKEKEYRDGKLTIVKYHYAKEIQNQIKANLNDSESFQVEYEDTYLLNDSTIVYELQFSAKNGFGGRIKKDISKKFYI